ncbi:MAG TPA: gluconate 2-dehydrogenase subunit 3 family protein, partial [Caulobacteraceae bacterium]|nr:gluconate 2-dehydrogenase subunit 3 family protein [Caulobacteraceae bacterium]
PVVGLQEIYRNGLAHLDAVARKRFGAGFASLPAASQDLILSDSADAKLQPFVAAALNNTLEAMYGPPEYGGDRNLVGWSYTHWAGDSQPKGYADDEVSRPGSETLCLAGPAEKAMVEMILTALAGHPPPGQSFWSACPVPAKP